jgi:hypothetical protein
MQKITHGGKSRGIVSHSILNITAVKSPGSSQTADFYLSIVVDYITERLAN